MTKQSQSFLPFFLIIPVMGNEKAEEKKEEAGNDGKFPEPEYKGCGPCRQVLLENMYLIGL